MSKDIVYHGVVVSGVAVSAYGSYLIVGEGLTLMLAGMFIAFYGFFLKLD